MPDAQILVVHLDAGKLIVKKARINEVSNITGAMLEKLKKDI